MSNRGGSYAQSVVTPVREVDNYNEYVDNFHTNIYILRKIKHILE